jgi:hypothetical protein
MVWVYGETPVVLAWALEGVREFESRAIESFDALTSAVEPGDVLVLAVIGPSGRGYRRVISRIRHRIPALPIVLCTHYDQQAAEWRAGMAPSRTVWLDDQPGALQRAVADVLVTSWRLHLAVAIDAAHDLSDRIRAALSGALRADQPPATRKGLARLARCGVSTLSRQWRSQVASRTGMTPHRFLQWLLVARAHELRQQLASWNDVAGALGVDKRTVEGAALASLGVPLETLERRSAAFVMQHLSQAMQGLSGTALHKAEDTTVET